LEERIEELRKKKLEKNVNGGERENNILDKLNIEVLKLKK
jgi:hypothetical protein